MAFEYAYDLSGCTYPVIKEFPIATDTNVSMGEVVALSAGLVVEVDADNDDPVLGVSAENHDGSSTGQTGTKIKIYCSPTAVFRLKNTYEAVADSGNATTFVDASYGTAGNDQFNGGAMKLIAKGAGSTLTLPLGSIVAITDFATTTGTFTGTFTGKTTAGDKYLLFPPVGAYAFDLDDAATALDLNSTGGEAIYVLENDMVNDYIFVKFRLHQLGAHPVAIA